MIRTFASLFYGGKIFPVQLRAVGLRASKVGFWTKVMYP